MLNQIYECVEYLKQQTSIVPKVGIILGTGLGAFDEEITVHKRISYIDIPNFPVSTVDGHNGNLIFGTIGNTPIIAMQGRFHFYEGYTMEQIIFPIRVMKFIGVSHLFLSNASGGMNPNYEIGDIMAISDHINCMPNPLIGPHFPELGPRFPDMGEPYDKSLIQKAHIIAQYHNIKLHEGCYVAVTGPTYETPKEYEYFRIIGADNIGMSTVPEVIAARQMEINCFALSVITDLGVPGKIVKITHEEVQQAAMKAEKKVAVIFKDLITELK